MRTRTFIVPTSGAPTASWQNGDATVGQNGSILPFTTPGGLPAGGGGSLQGPGSFVSAQFGLANAPASLILALGTTGSSNVIVNLESYSNFAWVTLNTASLGDTSSAATNLAAASTLGLLRLRVTISGTDSVRCVGLLNATGTTVTPPTTTTTSNEQFGIINIPYGVSVVPITFNSPFTTLPYPPWCSILRGSSVDPVLGVRDIPTLNLSGATVQLTAIATNGNYKLAWRTLPSGLTASYTGDYTGYSGNNAMGGSLL